MISLASSPSIQTADASQLCFRPSIHVPLPLDHVYLEFSAVGCSTWIMNRICELFASFVAIKGKTCFSAMLAKQVCTSNVSQRDCALRKM
eukprot:m.30606 g.30606  ORF g.30606 m.30606 type:complete len:90 (-) comp9303_c0_seq1:1939-2208(-)